MRRHVLNRASVSASCLAIALLGWGGAHAFQMTSPKRVPRPTATVETDLPPVHVDFRDVAEQAGLTAINVSGGETRKQYILETTGSGVAIFDADGDGWMDVFVVNATTFDARADDAATSHLYRNLGGLRFEDVTAKAGLRRAGWGQGACVGDYDNDGRRDLFVTSYDGSVLYHNEGNGAFADLTDTAGVRATTAWDTGCAFFDYDLDGRLDLVVTGYLEFDIAKVPPADRGRCRWKEMAVMCGPRGLPFTAPVLFHNEGGGRFRNVTAASGIGKARGCYGFTVVASDLDNDRYPDLYVACDSTPSQLFRNDKGKRFEEVGLVAGVALNEDGQEQSGMGVAAADYDDDGDIDLVKTNFSDDVPNVYENLGGLIFADRVLRAGLAVHTEYVGWGVGFLDFDHDGRKDLLMANGHVYPELGQSANESFRQPRLLYWNVGDGRFKDVSATAGPGIRDAASSRGLAVGDLDNDGSLEVVITNLGAQPSVLKNFGARRNWLVVQAVGTDANRDAVGARIDVHVGGRRLTGEVQTGTSYLSQHDSRLHFGLADDQRYERIEVQWPGATRKELFPGGRANRIVTLTQGTATAGR